MDNYQSKLNYLSSSKKYLITPNDSFHLNNLIIWIVETFLVDISLLNKNTAYFDMIWKKDMNK